MVEVRKNQRRDRKITVGEPRFAQKMAIFQEVGVNGATGGTTVDPLSDRTAARAGSDPVWAKNLPTDGKLLAQACCLLLQEWLRSGRNCLIRLVLDSGSLSS